MTAPDTPSRRIGGLYALIDLSGTPLDRRDLAALGLVAPDGARVAAQAIDAISPADAHRLADAARTTLFLGRLDEPEEIADRLGLPRTTPEPVLARAAFDRFGATTPDELLGGWMMLDHRANGAVTLLVGIGGRMPLLYARCGDRLAIAPSIHILSHLEWIGRTLDEDALLLSLTNCRPAEPQAQHTILRGVRRVPRGACVTIPRDGEPQVHIVDPFVAVPRWTGSRADAMAEAEALLRRIVRQHVSRAPAPGLLLSGGLDSSLIAWALAEDGATALPAFCSAVAPGRGVEDETRYAGIVADTLGLSLHRVVPPMDANVYRPSVAALSAVNVPPLSPRDYVYAAFADHAAALGVTELFDGAHGEFTFTGLMAVRFRHQILRATARRVRDAWRNRRDIAHDPVDTVFEVALAPHRLDHPAPILVDAVAAQVSERWDRRADEPWGYSFGADRPLRRDPTELRAGALRFARPFHDIRLLRLFARFPSRFMVGEGLTRWPARALMAKRLPDSIVRRRTGMPFSPDYEIRLAEQVPAALARIGAFRASACDELFDLDWLRDGLGRVATGTASSADELFRVQLTAHACEFLTWWRSG